MNGIKDNISWHKLGIIEIESALNGQEAYEIALKLKPDIILTDIRMPVMDGIEFAQKYKEIDSNCILIFMSGYSDKAYLKYAIKLNAINYIENPLRLMSLQKLYKKHLKFA